MHRAENLASFITMACTGVSAWRSHCSAQDVNSAAKLCTTPVSARSCYLSPGSPSMSSSFLTPLAAMSSMATTGPLARCDTRAEKRGLLCCAAKKLHASCGLSWHMLKLLHAGNMTATQHSTDESSKGSEYACILQQMLDGRCRAAGPAHSVVSNYSGAGEQILAVYHVPVSTGSCLT
jgi:hypothetical protein